MLLNFVNHRPASTEHGFSVAVVGRTLFGLVSTGVEVNRRISGLFRSSITFSLRYITS